MQRPISSLRRGPNENDGPRPGHPKTDCFLICLENDRPLMTVFKLIKFSMLVTMIEFSNHFSFQISIFIRFNSFLKTFLYFIFLHFFHLLILLSTFGGKFFSPKSSFVRKNDSTRKLNGFYF